MLHCVQRAIKVRPLFTCRFAKSHKINTCYLQTRLRRSFNFHFLVSTTINAEGQLVTDCKTHLETCHNGSNLFISYLNFYTVAIYSFQSWIDWMIEFHIFWGGHKILQNLHLTFVLCSASQKISKILRPSQNIWT